MSDIRALPALIWIANHPKGVVGLLYIEVPMMRGDVLRRAGGPLGVCRAAFTSIEERYDDRPR